MNTEPHDQNTTANSSESPSVDVVPDESAEKLRVVSCVEEVLAVVQSNPMGISENAAVGICRSDPWLVVAVLGILKATGYVSLDDDGLHRLLIGKRTSPSRSS